MDFYDEEEEPPFFTGEDPDEEEEFTEDDVIAQGVLALVLAIIGLFFIMAICNTQCQKGGGGGS